MRLPGFGGAAVFLRSGGPSGQGFAWELGEFPFRLCQRMGHLPVFCEDRGVSELSDAVLPLIRTRADLHRRSTANAHGVQMHQGVDILERAVETHPPAEVYSVTTAAIASAMKVIMRADDSSGIIGHACRRLLGMHPAAALAARVAPARLVDWMIAFQFANGCDFFEIDPVAYAPALGEKGVAAYRQRLVQQEQEAGPRPGQGSLSYYSRDWFVLDWNAQRMAVMDKDVEGIIRTHARDRKAAAWYEDTAQALAEIGEFDLAIDWAQQATYLDTGYQSLVASRYWCDLLAEHRPDDLLGAVVQVFHRWPKNETATRLYRTAGPQWDDYADEVRQGLAANPWEAVSFALYTLQDVPLAWEWAHTLALTDARLWDDLVEAYSKIDATAVLPVLRMRVQSILGSTDVRNYKAAAGRLSTMRDLARGTDAAADVDEFIAETREENRLRPRLQREFDKAGLP